MYHIGIDIGSSSAKIVVGEEEKVVDFFTLPTGWNGKDTAEQIYDVLSEKGFTKQMKCMN